MEINVMEILTGFAGADEFNYFFTLVAYFGCVGVVLGAIVNILKK